MALDLDPDPLHLTLDGHRIWRSCNESLSPALQEAIEAKDKIS